MIPIRQMLAVHRRAVARAPLRQLICWATVHALCPIYGMHVTPQLIDQSHRLLIEELLALSDRFAFAYFGIHSARDLGIPPVVLYVTEDGPPYGQVACDPTTTADYIMAGGAIGNGWLTTGGVTIKHLRG